LREKNISSEDVRKAKNVMDEMDEMEGNPETIKTEIKEMVKNHPRLVVQVISKMAPYVYENSDQKDLEKLINNLNNAIELS